MYNHLLVTVSYDHCISFDRDIAERIGRNLEDHGVRFVNETIPLSISKVDAANAGGPVNVKWGSAKLDLR